jgi:hypothetical protein
VAGILQNKVAKVASVILSRIVSHRLHESGGALSVEVLGRLLEPKAVLEPVLERFDQRDLGRLRCLDDTELTKVVDEKPCSSITVFGGSAPEIKARAGLVSLEIHQGIVIDGLYRHIAELQEMTEMNGRA